MTLSTVPMGLREANEFVANFHRHNRPVPGARFSVGASDGAELWGVAIVGRPVARMLQQQGGGLLRWSDAACETEALRAHARSCTLPAGAHGEQWVVTGSSPTRCNPSLAPACAVPAGG